MLRLRLSTAILLATLGASASQLSAQRGVPFRDPNGRFTINVPDGWNTISQNGSVIFTRGSISISILPFPQASSPDEIVSSLSQTYGQQWRNLQGFDRGSFQVGGAPATYAMFNGTNPRGVPSLLRLVGIGRGSSAFAFIVSVPTNEVQGAKDELWAMEQSFSTGGGRGRGNTQDPQFPQQRPQQDPQFPQQRPQQDPQFPQQRPQQDPQFPQQRPPQQQPQFPQQQPQFPQQQPQFPPSDPSASGKVSMGVALRDLDKNDQTQLGMKDTRGALVAQLQAGSAAERAGIVQGDVIVSADGQSINSATDLVKVISSHRMGDQIEVTVVRQGRPQVLRVQFGGSGRGRPVIPTE